MLNYSVVHKLPRLHALVQCLPQHHLASRLIGKSRIYIIFSPYQVPALKNDKQKVSPPDAITNCKMKDIPQHIAKLLTFVAAISKRAPRQSPWLGSM